MLPKAAAAGPSPDGKRLDKCARFLYDVVGRGWTHPAKRYNNNDFGEFVRDNPDAFIGADERNKIKILLR